MKRTIFFLSLLLGTSPLPHAQEIDGVTVGNLKMDRNGEYLVVEMDVELSRLEVEANRAVLLTPRLVNGADSADLPAVGIYGRAPLLLLCKKRRQACCRATARQVSRPPKNPNG